MTAEEVAQMKSSGTCPEQSYLHVSIADLLKHVQSSKQVVHEFKEEFEREMQKVFEEQHNEEDGWLMSAVTSNESEDGVFATPPSWTAYHAAQKRDQSPNIPTINSVLPIIYHMNHSRDLQFHIMNIAQDYTAYLNPG